MSVVCAILVVSHTYYFYLLAFIRWTGTRLAAVIETAQAGQVFEAPIGIMPQILKVAQKYFAKK